MTKSFLFSLAVLSVASPAHADERSEPRVSITVSPVHLVIPVGELTAELRAHDKLGIAAVVGIGSVSVDRFEDRVAVYEAGISARYYLTGSFRTGIQLGAEALYLHAATKDDSMAVRAQGLGLSPFAGYKWTGRSGLTLEGQLGVTYVAVRADSETAAAEDSRVGPMVNLNIGYGF
ncbi:MAG: hypothetical protein WKG01_25335 [Kofleriaceae bacterium]